jgi:hypothetical protein
MSTDAVAIAQPWAGTRWPVWSCRIVGPGEPIPVADAGDWTGGVFMSAPKPEQPSDAPPMLDIATCGPQLLRTALQVDVASTDSLLAFVNTWGQLGVGLGLARDAEARARSARSQFRIDSLWATRRALSAIHEHFHWLVALKRRAWSAPEIPRAPETDDALRETLQALIAEPDRRAITSEDLVILTMLGTTDPYVSGVARRTVLLRGAHAPDLGMWRGTGVTTPELHWRAFSVSLEDHLRLIHPMIRVTKAGAAPAWRVNAPIDALWAELWNYATQGGRIVRCLGCNGWFVRDRRNKTHCTAECANRATSRRWYEEVGRKQRGHAKRKITKRKRGSR